MKKYISFLGLLALVTLSLNVQATFKSPRVINKTSYGSLPVGLEFGPVIKSTVADLKADASQLKEHVENVLAKYPTLTIAELKNLSAEQIENVKSDLLALGHAVKGQFKARVKEILADIPEDVKARAKEELQHIAGFGMAGTPPITNLQGLANLAEKIKSKAAEFAKYGNESQIKAIVDKLSFEEKVKLYKEIKYLKGLYHKLHETVQNFIMQLPEETKGVVTSKIRALQTAAKSYVGRLQADQPGILP